MRSKVVGASLAMGLMFARAAGAQDVASVPAAADEPPIGREAFEIPPSTWNAILAAGCALEARWAVDVRIDDFDCPQKNAGDRMKVQIRTEARDKTTNIAIEVRGPDSKELDQATLDASAHALHEEFGRRIQTPPRLFSVRPDPPAPRIAPVTIVGAVAGLFGFIGLTVGLAVVQPPKCYRGRCVGLDPDVALAGGVTMAISGAVLLIAGGLMWAGMSTNAPNPRRMPTWSTRWSPPNTSERPLVFSGAF
jgi:hypothetical protein